MQVFTFSAMMTGMQKNNIFTRYHEAIDYLEGLLNIPSGADYMAGKVHADIYIKRMRYFLDLVGAPDKGMKFIHVAGTAGKGTVVTMIKEMLHASGKVVGADTSPFVTTSIEKIEVGGKYIAPDEFADIVDYLKPYLDKAHAEGPYGLPSYFEVFFAIAFIYFKKMNCEWAVLETGLGGRYDASNVITDPAVTVITNIDYDHTEILGKTLTKIARDKAGIIKRGSAFFTTEGRPKILRIFRDICEEKNVKMTVVPSRSGVVEANKLLVAAIGEYLGIPQKFAEQGILRAKLPARFEIMQKNPLVILDGAHNRAKMRHTARCLSQLRYEKLYLIIGVAENKDYEQVLREIVPFASHTYLTRFQLRIRKCAPPKTLRAIAERYARDRTATDTFLDPKQALMQAMRNAGRNDTILVTGSFFLAGELRHLWHSETEILKRRQSF